MLVKLGNQIFSVGFKHTLPDPGIKMSAVKTNGGTECYINELVDDGLGNFFKKPFAGANLKCYYKDTFSKEIGRKNALAEAIKGFSRDERTAFWNAYRNRNVVK